MQAKTKTNPRYDEKMAPRFVFWVDRHVDPKFTMFVWKSDGK